MLPADGHGCAPLAVAAPPRSPSPLPMLSQCMPCSWTSGWVNPVCCVVLCCVVLCCVVLCCVVLCCVVLCCVGGCGHPTCPCLQAWAGRPTPSTGHSSSCGQFSPRACTAAPLSQAALVWPPLLARGRGPDEQGCIPSFSNCRCDVALSYVSRGKDNGCGRGPLLPCAPRMPGCHLRARARRRHVHTLGGGFAGPAMPARAGGVGLAWDAWAPGCSRPLWMVAAVLWALRAGP